MGIFAVVSHSTFHFLKIKNRSRLTAETIGHIPKELSRATGFFLKRGGKISGIVYEKNIDIPRYLKED